MCNHRVDVPEEMEEREVAISLFRSHITTNPFHDIQFMPNDVVILSDVDGDLLGQTTVEFLMKAGAQA